MSFYSSKRKGHIIKLLYSFYPLTFFAIKVINKQLTNNVIICSPFIYIVQFISRKRERGKANRYNNIFFFFFFFENWQRVSGTFKNERIANLQLMKIWRSEQFWCFVSITSSSSLTFYLPLKFKALFNSFFSFSFFEGFD